MQSIPEATFREWLAAAGIVRHPTWGNTDSLCFADADDYSRFWFPSFVPSDLPGFLGTAFRALSAAGPYYLMRRGGGDFYEDLTSAPLGNHVINDTLRMCGVPAQASGGLRLATEEHKSLLAIVLAFYIHGWSIGEDLYVFSEERDAVLMTSHHGELAGHFPSAERMEGFRTQMLEAGYDLPDQVPDETFKSPAWLKGRLKHGSA